MRASVAAARFPRLYAAASLKPTRPSGAGIRGSCFPRLYAAASLKHVPFVGRPPIRGKFSAALCRGLIEAPGSIPLAEVTRHGFPRLYAAASLKQDFLLGERVDGDRVFRGFMPRPH